MKPWEASEGLLQAGQVGRQGRLPGKGEDSQSDSVAGSLRVRQRPTCTKAWRGEGTGCSEDMEVRSVLPADPGTGVSQIGRMLSLSGPASVS